MQSRRPPHLLIVSHAMVAQQNRAFLPILRSRMQDLGGDLQVVAPGPIREPWGLMRAAPAPSESDFLFPREAVPTASNGLRTMLPGWTRGLHRPTHVHCQEEPYWLMAAQVALATRRWPARLSIFSHQNLEIPLPAPIRMLERWVGRRLDSAVASNSAAAERLARLMPNPRVAVLAQFGVELPAAIRQQAAAASVIFAGRLVAEKGIDDILAAARQLPEVRFSLLGTGPMESVVRASLASLPNVALLGPVPHDRVQAEIANHDILVLPSRPLPNWIEQFGRVLVEAMACGVIAIGSDSGAIPEVVGDPALIFPAGDRDRLTTLLRRLNADLGWRRSLGLAARARAENEYSHQALAGRLLAAIGISDA